MTRSMADSVTATDIPPGRFDLVAGYVDGLYRWTDADWLFHHASRLVRITVGSGTLDADVADVETGDFNPDQGMAWIRAKLARGEHGTLYFSSSRNAEVDGARVRAGLSNNDYSVWSAQWDGQPVGLPYTIAHQYANPALSGGHYDLSVVADYWPGVDPPPPAPPPPGPPPPGPPPPTPPPGPPPVPPPTPVPPIDQTRSAFGNLAAFLTSDVPAFVQEILRLLGLYNKTP